MNKKKILHEIRVFGLMLFVLLSLRSALADWNDVPTGSMKPTIQEGDRVVVNKLAYDLKVPFTTWHLATWDNPKRGDVVVFFSPYDGMRLVKRVAAVPGDTVELRQNQLLVNGQAAQWSNIVETDVPNEGPARVLDETLLGRSHKVMLKTLSLSSSSKSTYGPVQVPDGYYFCLGDNRDNSQDSRWIGMIARRRIVGKAEAVAFSFERWYKPRPDRFFHGLE